MSFWSAVGGVFKKAAHVADKVTDALEPFQGILNYIPGPAGTILTYVLQAERLVDGQSNGGEKKAAVIAFVKLAYPKLDQAVVATEIDNLVGILNRLSKAVEAEK